MKSLQEFDSENILMKNNVLIKAKYNLTVSENRIFTLMLYNLQKINNGALQCTLSNQELKKIIKSKNRLKKDNKEIFYEPIGILDRLSDNKIWFREEKEHGMEWGKYNLINGYTYSEINDNFTIECSQKVYDILINYLGKNYTPINLGIWLSLKSIYSQRIYDLLRLWSYTKSIIKYDLDELKELLMIKDKYSKYNDLKRRVIVPAVKELNETGYFSISFTEKKKSKKVVAIEFIVEDLDNRKYFQRQELDTKDKKQTNSKKRIGDISRQKTKFHNFNETFTKYTTDELDDIIAKSQKEKYK